MTREDSYSDGHSDGFWKGRIDVRKVGSQAYRDGFENGKQDRAKDPLAVPHRNKK